MLGMVYAIRREVREWHLVVERNEKSEERGAARIQKKNPCKRAWEFLMEDGSTKIEKEKEKESGKKPLDKEKKATLVAAGAVEQKTSSPKKRVGKKTQTAAVTPAPKVESEEKSEEKSEKTTAVAAQVPKVKRPPPMMLD